MFPAVDGGGGINYSDTLDLLPPGLGHGGDRRWNPSHWELQLAERGAAPCLQPGYGSPGPRHVALMVPSHTLCGQQHVIVLPLLSTAFSLYHSCSQCKILGKKCGHNIRIEIEIAHCVLT